MILSLAIRGHVCEAMRAYPFLHGVWVIFRALRASMFRVGTIGSRVTRVWDIMAINRKVISLKSMGRRRSILER